MQSKRFFALLLALCLLTGLLGGCGNKPDGKATETPKTEPSATPAPTEPTEPAPAEDPGADYLAAVAALQAESALTIATKIHTDCTMGGEAVVEKQEETARYQDLGGENPVISVTRKLHYSGEPATFRQVYSGQELYTEVSDYKYWAPETEENFLSQLAPAAMLDPANYASVTREGEKLIFSEAAQGEAWALPDGGKLESASGWAVLKDGVVTQQSYDLSYTYAGTPIHLNYTSELSVGVDADLSKLVPAGKGEYTRLESTEAILALLRAKMAILHAKTIEVHKEETIFSQASAEILQNRDDFYVYGSGRDTIFLENWEYAFMDLQGKQTESSSTMERMDAEGYAFQEEEQTPETMQLSDSQRTSIANNVRMNVSIYAGLCIPDPSDLTDAKVYDAGDYYLVEYACGEDFSRLMDQWACKTFYNDEDKLMDLGSAYNPGTMEGYVAVEKHTWIPTAAGASYVASHIIESQPYRIAMQVTVGMSLYDLDTYEEIMDEPLPDKEPEEKADPVFYEVKGEGGETLYLFGTIHVGDDRTGFLPQAIYDAFDSADALAVEFDDAEFEEQIQNDPALMQRVAGAYYYLDGSTIGDHLEDDEDADGEAGKVYENAVRFMKITGQYNDNAERLKPFVWGNAIENFYLSQGRKLTSAKGVDHRLMARAREQEKEILSVESGISQLEMMANYSDKLQQLLLEESMHTRRCDYLDGVYELYDLWCAGDEAVLIERLAGADEEDLSEMDEEERALYEEYHSAMETDRNAQMLETAKGYLSGGKTVFFAVGLAHLLGDGGLVQALRDAGYTVTLIQGG